MNYTVRVTNNVVEIFTKTYESATSMLGAINETLAEIMKRVDDIQDDGIRSQIQSECRYIKRSLNSLVSSSKNHERLWIQDVRKFNRENNIKMLSSSCEMTKTEFLKLIKILNCLITRLDKCMEAIEAYKQPFKDAKLILGSTEDERKKEVCMKLIHKRQTDIILLDFVRSNLLQTKKRIADLNKRYVSAISKYNMTKDLIL